MAAKKDLLLLFDHPTEPVFMDKGGDGTVFHVPESYVTHRYKEVCKEIQGRVSGGDEKCIPVKEISVPDLSYPMSLGRTEQFSLFLESHCQKACHLIDVFMKMSSVEDLLSVGVYARDRVNPVMFNYALSVALLHRPDTRDLSLPSISECFPDRFIDSQTFSNMREECYVVQKSDSRKPSCLPVIYTASDLDVEHRLWYFREDIGVNLHHWHWHLVYPFEGNRSMVDKDRRGELFYYMHQQIIARYNAERLSNHMARVQPFSNLDEPIAEGYFPKMHSSATGRPYPPRFDGTRLRDVDRPDLARVGIDDMKRWRERIFEAIHQGYVLTENNEKMVLDEVKGIDILGNMVEASDLSVNRTLHLEDGGLMNQPETAMRDPIFYRWHAFIDNLFQEHKRLLPAYSEEELSFPDIQVQGICVVSEGQTNKLTTFWQKSDVAMSRGLDFLPRCRVSGRFTHLQHHPFTYNIKVENFSKDTRRGFVRIFLAPKFDDRNDNMVLEDQRLMMVEMDKFVITMPHGGSTVSWNSTKSSVTIPFERTLRNLDGNENQDESSKEINDFCGCGWPHHMLVPKGRPEGLAFKLFVMVSNYDEDRVEQNQESKCAGKDAASYCGLRDLLYPDRKSMGYPFDRRPRNGVQLLDDFLTPNMSTVEVTITHENRGKQVPE
ncbi:hypothetical protein KR084_007657 [Drosophila pseudotakahashii]|nr:hypothetical protein KR084_007657 [Drosophila pseudotakahashii]